MNIIKLKDIKVIINDINNSNVKNKESIIKILQLQIPKNPILQSYSPALCPNCGKELSKSVGDGYYKHNYNCKICDCGQKIKWKK